MPEMRILILGGRGFIGSHLTDALRAAGHAVRSFDQSPAPSQDTQGLQHIQADYANDQALQAALEGCDICYHLISTTLPSNSNANPVFDIDSNLSRTVRLLDMAVQSKLKKIIFTSSGGTVYGTPRYLPIDEHHPTEPTCSYGITKLAIEKYLALYQQLHGLDHTVLRIANPFGERQRIHANQGAVAVFMGKILRGETLDIWGDGSIVRDYIHISDVMTAMLQALQPNPHAERVFNIGSGQGHSLNQVLDAIENVTQRPSHRRYLLARQFDVPVSILDITRAQHILGWQPQTGFEQGLQRFYSWVQSGQVPAHQAHCV